MYHIRFKLAQDGHNILKYRGDSIIKKKNILKNAFNIPDLQIDQPVPGENLEVVSKLDSASCTQYFFEWLPCLIKKIILCWFPG